MKLVKMSLAAAVLLGASAFAIDNVKVSGDAKLFYSTNNMGTNDLFNQGAFGSNNSVADTALRIGATGDLAKGISFGVTGYAVSTLGLENNLVSNTWTGAHGAQANGSQFTAQVDDASWLGEAWVAATLGKTTAKLGRMALDTPLAFSETWSIVPNTMEAAVLINQDLPDTTLVGAWVGKGNGTNSLHPSYSGPVGIDGVVGAAGNFNTFMNDGAYAAAIVNNTFKPLVAQAWYYNVVNVADAYWLQADWDCQLVKGAKIGAQYADLSPKGLLEGVKDSSAYAVKVAYEGVENLKLSAAYSTVDEDGTLKVANVATANLSASQSKLYTEANWNYGYVGRAGADSYNVIAEYNAKDIAKFTAQYTDVSEKAAAATVTTDMSEVALTVSKSFGPLDASLVYISTDADDQNTGSQYDTIQAYLTLNF